MRVRSIATAPLRIVKPNAMLSQIQELPQLNGYYGMTAHKSAAERRARRRKLVRIPELREAVIDRLQEGWSPEQIAGRLKFEGHATTVSHETIYAYAYSPDGESQALARYLPDRCKKRKPSYARTPPGMTFPPERSIHNRPEHIKTRETFGAWQGDLMIFRREHGKTNVTSLVERKTRYAVLFRNNDRSSNHFMTRLMNIMDIPAPDSTSVNHL
nr:IS30 family transposase [Epibacterium ulvae]